MSECPWIQVLVQNHIIIQNVFLITKIKAILQFVSELSRSYIFKAYSLDFFRKICASFSLERLTSWKILIWQVRRSFFLTQENLATSIEPNYKIKCSDVNVIGVFKEIFYLHEIFTYLQIHTLHKYLLSCIVHYDYIFQTLQNECNRHCRKS